MLNSNIFINKRSCKTWLGFIFSLIITGLKQMFLFDLKNWFGKEKALTQGSHWTEECASSSSNSPLGVGGRHKGSERKEAEEFSQLEFLSCQAAKLKSRRVLGDVHAVDAGHGGGMRTCARWWRRRDALPLRSLLLLVPPFLLTLQLLLVCPGLPHGSRRGLDGQEGSVAFSVISIEPEGRTRQLEPTSRGPLVEALGEDAGAPAYQDENEMLSRKVNQNNQLQPVALQILVITLLVWIMTLTFELFFSSW